MIFFGKPVHTFPDHALGYAEQATLRCIDSALVNRIFAFLAISILVALELAKQRPMDALDVLLPNWTFPNSLQRSGYLVLPRKTGEVFSVLDVLSKLREQ